MTIESDLMDDLANRDEAYFDVARPSEHRFDAKLLKQPIAAMPSRPPIVLAGESSVKEAMQAMQQPASGLRRS